jgi:hypothetical protein
MTYFERESMSKQPEALRLAHALEQGKYLLSVERDATAAELRRLHEVNAELLEALKEAEDALADYIPSLEKNGAMLNYGRSVWQRVKAAIAKAEGRT